jgi:hypothetical protein
MPNIANGESIVSGLSAVRPALARYLRRSPDETAAYTYSEELHVSVWGDGSPVVATSSDETGTFAERDTPDPSTSTRAERDAGDVVDASLSQRRRQLGWTATQAERDHGEPSTTTKGARDPGDVLDETLTRRDGRQRKWALGHVPSDVLDIRRLPLTIFTEAARDRDDDSVEPDGDATDDLVTGIVAF